MVTITEGVEFDTVAREWRCKVCREEDNGKWCRLDPNMVFIQHRTTVERRRRQKVAPGSAKGVGICSDHC